MGQRKISDYLDTGSLVLFAQHVIEVVEGAVAVAIHDIDGELVWAGPNEGDSEYCKINPFAGERPEDTGFCRQIDEKNIAYVVYLDCEESDDLMSAMSVMVKSENPVSFEAAYRELQPIVACIERQVAINAELSSVRRMSSEGRHGLELLVKMDELNSGAGPEATLQSVLELSAGHFNCGIVAVSLPHLGMQQTHPATALTDPESSKQLRVMLDSLNAAAAKHKKVLVSDEAMNVKNPDGSTHEVPPVHCSPIINTHDEVIGIFVLIGGGSLPRESAKLVRAICTKINAFTGTADQIKSEHFSRHGLLQHMHTVLTENPGKSQAFLYLDIDKLHVVNDSFGHKAGDQVIRKIIGIVDDHADDNDAVSHLSGDRLGLFLHDCDEKKAVKTAEGILQTLAKDSTEHNGHLIDIAASIGIALVPDVVTDAAAALSTAEVAARSAKDRGGNRAVVFRDIDASVMQRRSDLDQVGYLQSAFIEDRFVLYAQTIQSLADSEKSSRYEILVRMLDVDGQLILPGQFMSAAERYNMMPTLDRWVINKALEQLGSSENTLEINLASFSINVSGQSLVDDDFVDHIAKRILESGVSPEALCFEITETAIVRNLDQAQRFIRKLGSVGCRMALDDFGTGHCSFAYLKDLPVQYIKIDGVFIRDILENPLSEAIVTSVTNIAKVMHASTVAEHVENDLILKQLRKYDVDFVQGFAIDRPRPLSEILDEMGPAVLFDTTTNVVRTPS